MLGLALLGIFNGAVIAASRTLNGRLGVDVGPFKASLWNHIVGFVFLTVVLLILGNLTFHASPATPPSAYLGGVVGALFVALNSFVLPRLGVTKTTLLVIGGQMITGVILDLQRRGGGSTLAQFVGVGVILFGVYLARTSSARRSTAAPGK